jgi:hypothetical protein
MGLRTLTSLTPATYKSSHLTLNLKILYGSARLEFAFGRGTVFL